jgi:2-oxoglutarate dehydrogenase E1 component
MGRGEVNVDWGMGEHMAFASLVAAATRCACPAKDCGRGTFTHRHAVLHDQKREKFDEGTYIPLQNVADGQAPVRRDRLILSEEAVLGFEYGYRSNDPNTLVIWEAQFGDFVNGAQVVIDQFIASGEVKWGRVNGITLMLPHGYEGPGPRAQLGRAWSASCSCRPTPTCRWCSPPRPARSSTCCAADGAQPAQAAGHHDAQVAAAEQGRDLAAVRVHQGSFQTVIPDSKDLKADKVKRCRPARARSTTTWPRSARKGRDDVAIMRVEQLYPVPAQGLSRGTEEVPEPHRHRVVPGRAAEPGRLVLHAAQHPREHAGRPEAGLRRPRRLGVAGGRLFAPAPGAAEGAGRRRFGKLKGFVLTNKSSEARLRCADRLTRDEQI